MILIKIRHIAYIYIYNQSSEKIQLDFSILRHMPYLIFNFVLSELSSVKIKKSKSNYIINWILIEIQFPSHVQLSI